MNTTMARAAAAAGGLAIAAAFAVSCSSAKEATENAMSSASSIGSSAASAAGSAASSAGSAAGSAASSAASAAGSAASSGASVASSAVSSVLNGAPTSMNVPGVGEVTLDGPTADAYTKFGGEKALGMPARSRRRWATAPSLPSPTARSSPRRHRRAPGAGRNPAGLQRAGRPRRCAGFPTADETQTGGGPKAASGGWITEFQNGTITWLNDGQGNFTETVTKK